jgi:hypothetical protein
VAQIGIVNLQRGYVEQPQNCLPAPNPLFAMRSTISLSQFGELSGFVQDGERFRVESRVGVTDHFKTSHCGSNQNQPR